MATLALLRLSKEFPVIFKRSFIAMFIVDKDNIILDANDMFCKIFGYGYDELIGQSVKILHINDKSYQKFYKKAKDDIDQYSTTLLVYEFKHKNGNHIWLRISADLVKEARETTWTLTDITEQIENENKIRELNKHLNDEVKRQLEILREKEKQLQYQSRLAQMGEMLNMIAHQWRQPLAAISATTGFLTGKLMLEDRDNGEFLDEIKQIEDCAMYLSRTISDFRNFFKSSNKKENFIIENVIDDMLKIILPILNSKGICVQTQYESQKEIFSYKFELGHALLNIIKNAEDALLANSIKEPFIKISTSFKKGKIYIDIKDNAGGIAQDILPHIFDPYFSTKTKSDGTGIGLYMSKTIIQNHCQGAIYASNSAYGACFSIVLPNTL
ncbi:MAG: PAS domain-containing sensor histidine kinase [Campylobacter sp.]|nr:PAS domain-containing sensor histidine kinase [Campylobacter sp.]